MPYTHSVLACAIARVPFRRGALIKAGAMLSEGHSSASICVCRQLNRTLLKHLVFMPAERQLLAAVAAHTRSTRSIISTSDVCDIFGRAISFNLLRPNTCVLKGPSAKEIIRPIECRTAQCIILMQFFAFLLSPRVATSSSSPRFHSFCFSGRASLG